MTSNFKQRLKRLHGSRLRSTEASDGATAGVYTAEDAERKIEQPVSAAAPTDPKGWEQAGAARLETTFGCSYLISAPHLPSYQHGTRRLSDGLAFDHKMLHGLTARTEFGRLEAEDLLYLDIETNGLDANAAIYAFCVGVGRWQGDTFIVEQHVIEAPDDEQSMLASLAVALRQARGLCTFNGKSFDVPRLAARYAHFGMQQPFDHLLHADLLLLARKHIAGQKRYKLSSLEESQLGFFRVGDVPGRRIPPLWNRYLAQRNVDLLSGVIEHNRHDIVSMPLLLAAIGEHYAAPTLTPTARPGVQARATHRTERFSFKINENPSKPTPRPDARPEDGNPKCNAKGDSKGNGIAARLTRSYALRSKGAPAPQTPSPGHTTGEGSTSIGDHLRRLRDQATAHIQSNDLPRALPILHEMAALSPQNPFPLEHLAAYYRSVGNATFAEHFEARLRSIVPY